ncbi:class I SAM-dependent methyltransferase [Phenylobacterium sp.]|uniref:class I SAM-dependent methyltransferase n=1 Tax=Phenylobacterium sp. TaxID=1871053 RepID=UPI0027195F7D|nr:class I SAM-dependent methyltransferase [Phenylobacterium sp.]MDO8799382.1 class I SAM-dependent methyltransferase [Phenylobacterium sp.]
MTAPPNWSQAAGNAWVELQDLMDGLYQPIAETLITTAFPGEGGAVLDIGCGAGTTTLQMARRLGPLGRAAGVDISAPLLEAARAGAEAQGIANATFLQGDAQTLDLGTAAYEAAISRFGVMFFADFDSAFANLRRALKPGGRLAFACWRSPADNPLASAPLEAAAPFLPPIPQADPDAPGRWAFADPDRVRGILTRSGWRDIEIAPLDVPTPIALDDLMRLTFRLGALPPLLQQADAATREKVHAAVAERLASYEVEGVVPMTAACWRVTARG